MFGDRYRRGIAGTYGSQLCFEEFIQTGSSLWRYIIHAKWHFSTSFVSLIMSVHPEDEQHTVERKWSFQRLASFKLLLHLLHFAQDSNTEPLSTTQSLPSSKPFCTCLLKKHKTKNLKTLGTKTRSDRWNTQTTLKNICTWKVWTVFLTITQFTPLQPTILKHISGTFFLFLINSRVKKFLF